MTCLIKTTNRTRLTSLRLEEVSLNVNAYCLCIFITLIGLQLNLFTNFFVFTAIEIVSTIYCICFFSWVVSVIMLMCILFHVIFLLFQ